MLARKNLFCLLLMLVGSFVFGVSGATAAERAPNIVLIYADDLGYGDLSCYGAKAVATPNIDRLAASGLRFTNGYCTSSTCTPSRYSMLTGEYAWRKQGTGILPGDAALIIDVKQPTMASILKKAGYATGLIGKWHLGLGDGKQEIDWNKDIAYGPRELGFDYAFMMAATGDRTPCVYLENQKVVGLDPRDPIQVNYKERFPGEPTGKDNPELLTMKANNGHNNALINGIGRIGFMKGGKAALWKDEMMADDFTAKGVQFIEKNKDQPFFLYFAAHDIHVPRVPHPRFVGKTDMGPRGDAIVQFDACVGELMATLDRLKLTDNTLVILSSDNGPVVNDGYTDQAVAKLGDHKPAGPLRGGKYSIYEGGTRVPFITAWPGKIKPGTSDALVSQIDFCADFAKLTGQNLAAGECPDSRDSLAALLGEDKTGREHILEHSGNVAIRAGQWKYIPAGKGNEKGPDKVSLFDVVKDPGEQHNVAAEHPEVVKKLASQLTTLRESPPARQ